MFDEIETVEFTMDLEDFMTPPEELKKMLERAYRRQTNKPKHSIQQPVIRRIIFNGPATVVFWADGTKTVVKCSEHDRKAFEGADPYAGFCAALAKKVYGSNSQIKKIIEKKGEREAW